MTADGLAGAPLDAAQLEAIEERVSDAIRGDLLGMDEWTIIRDDVPALVAEVRRLRAVLEEIEYLADCGMAVAATQAARAALAAPGAGGERETP